MVVVALVVVGVACVLVAWIFDMTMLAYVALGAALAGLIIIALRAWRIRRANKAVAAPESGTGEDVEERSGGSISVQVPQGSLVDADGTAADVTVVDESTEPVSAIREVVPAADEDDAPGPCADGPVRVAPAPVAVTSAFSDALADEAIVHVVPGRKRFHLAVCNLLADREFDDLTVAEAREEGFSACTRCCHRHGVVSAS